MASVAGSGIGVGIGGRAGKVFMSRPDRIAAAWRKLRCAQLPPGEPPRHLLDDVMESLIREIGAALDGQSGSPWARTTGVLRLSRSRGPKALFDEFSTLRRCLLSSLEVLSATEEERVLVETSLDEATDCAVALQEALDRSEPSPVPVPFGGVVLEVFDRLAPHPLSSERAAPLLH